MFSKKWGGIYPPPPPNPPVAPPLLVSQKEFTGLVGCGVKSMGPIFKTEMLLYQSKANLNEQILFDKITHKLDLELGKCW